MNTQLPTIALVHGAFAESASWTPVIERLFHPDPILVAGPHQTFSDVVAIANPLRSLAGDAAYVRDVIRALDDPIVLVGHSYGGMVITEAAAGLDSVVALVYVGAFAPEHGESAFQLSTMFPGSTLGDALNAHPVSTGGSEFVIRPDLFHHQFAADVPGERAALMGATQRPVTQAALAEGLPTRTPAWKDTRSWFVYGDQDLNIPAALQRFMAERANCQGTREVPGASHAISVSNPDAVSASIHEAVAATTLERTLVPPDGRLVFLEELLEEHATIAGDVIELGEHAWAIHGSITVDGEEILAEFETEAQARVVLDQLSSAEDRRDRR